MGLVNIYAFKFSISKSKGLLSYIVVVLILFLQLK